MFPMPRRRTSIEPFRQPRVLSVNGGGCPYWSGRAAWNSWRSELRNMPNELALLDAVDSGNAIAGMRADMRWTVETLRYFAGLATEIKGETKTLETASPQPHS